MMKIESHHEAHEEHQGTSDFARFVIISKKIIGVNLRNLWRAFGGVAHDPSGVF